MKIILAATLFLFNISTKSTAQYEVGAYLGNHFSSHPTLGYLYKNNPMIGIRLAYQFPKHFRPFLEIENSKMPNQKSMLSPIIFNGELYFEFNYIHFSIGSDFCLWQDDKWHIAAKTGLGLAYVYNTSIEVSGYVTNKNTIIDDKQVVYKNTVLPTSQLGILVEKNVFKQFVVGLHIGTTVFLKTQQTSGIAKIQNDNWVVSVDAVNVSQTWQPYLKIVASWTL